MRRTLTESVRFPTRVDTLRGYVRDAEMFKNHPGAGCFSGQMRPMWSAAFLEIFTIDSINARDDLKDQSTTGRPAKCRSPILHPRGQMSEQRTRSPIMRIWIRLLLAGKERFVGRQA
ncbi:MAG TPA: hypothetical protein VFE89_09105 [Beijerinckiaceae bacterium]|nr:hypothetical protein [Beijerinckiaceae bacterium]